MSNVLPALSSEAGLARYLQEIQKFPMLTDDVERSLALRFIKSNDLSAAHDLVTSHLRLVVKIAMTFRGYGLSLLDLISEGNIGLMKAVKKFDPNMGCRLGTYSTWWIKASIQDYILKSWSLVKVGTSALHKKLFFNLKKVKEKIAATSNLLVDEQKLVAKQFGISSQQVSDFEAAYSSNDQSLNSMIDSDGTVEMVDLIEDTSQNQELSLINKEEKSINMLTLKNAMSDLTERELHIIKERKLKDKPTTLEDLSSLYGVSRERIRQIEERAFTKLRCAFGIS